MNDQNSQLAVPVSDDDHVRGAASAAVTLVEYGDYQCPACARAHPAVQQARRRFGDDLRFVFRNFPLLQIHPYARPAAEVAEAAATLGGFWAMHDWLYENQEVWASEGPPALERGARELSMDVEALAEAVQDPAIERRIGEDYTGGMRSGVDGTPSFFVNGALHQGDFRSLEQAIEEAIAGGR